MPDQSSTLSPRLILGVGITAIGVLMLIDTLGFFDADRLLRFWPILLIVLGARILQKGSGSLGSGWYYKVVSGRWMGGGMLMLFGTLLLLRELNVVTVSMGELWPLFIILAGFGILMRGRRRSGKVGTSAPSEDRVSEFAVLSSLSPRVTSKSFQGGELNAFMGGCELDLRDADIDGEVEIEIFAMMGGIQIAVPKDWSVNAQITPFMGGMEDKTGSSERSSDKRLILRGFVMMGGVEIIN